MNKYQYRCIKESLIRDKYLTNLLLEPIMGKTIDDIKFKFKDFEEVPMYHLTKGNHTYTLRSYGNSRITESLYVITHNDKIIYYKTSPIFVEASSAWHMITAVYHGYKAGMAKYEWQSVDDFDCYNISDWHTDIYNYPWFQHYLSDYQRQMYDKTKKLYIDKRLITKEQEQEILKELYQQV